MIKNLTSKIGQILLSPLALLYGIGVGIRSFLYRTNLLKSSKFDIPLICVGNISTGGTGKTPHIEYLIKTLSPYIQVSVLSRGYKRKTEGFKIVEENNSALEVGDEPLQFKRKYPSVPVAVGEKRAYAIPQLLYRYPNIQLILLDDAFQHLAVRPYLNILLTEYSQPFPSDYLLPAGNLRDWRQSYRRADIIVVTKCPLEESKVKHQELLTAIQAYPHQRVYFSYYDYGQHYPIFPTNEAGSMPHDLDKETDVLLICGIAKSSYLVDYLSSKVKSVTTMAFEDHRLFTNYDIAQLKSVYDNMSSKNKVIITTEKDATRLELHKDYIIENQLNIFAIPIEFNFHFDEKQAFNDDIKQALLNFKV